MSDATPAGIILGMCLLGAIGDRIGRRKGSITTASIMLFGALMLTVQNGVTMKGFTIMYMISQFVFGWGPPGLHARLAIISSAMLLPLFHPLQSLRQP